MKVFCVFFAMIILGILDISCSSCKKEIHSEQTETERTPVLLTTEEKTAVKDTISSTASLQSAATTEDTVTGILYVTGNEPFTKLTLFVTSDTLFHIEADSSIKSQLWQLQGKRVCVVGMKKSGPTGRRINISSFHITP